MRFFSAFFSVVRQMPGSNPQRRGMARTIPNFCVVLCIFVLCRSLYCLCICVLYYCHRVATQLQLNIPYHIIWTINAAVELAATAFTAEDCRNSENRGRRMLRNSGTSFKNYRVSQSRNWILRSINSRHRHVTLSHQQITVRNLCHLKTARLYECEVTIFQDVIWLNSVTFQTTKQKPAFLCWNVWFHIGRKITDDLITQITYARSPTRHQKLQEPAKHCRARMTTWGETTVPSFMVQMPLRAVGPTQGHIIIHTLTQVILLHDSLCLSITTPNKFKSAQISYQRRCRRLCHLAIVKIICRSVYWLNRKIVTQFMRGQRPPFLYSVKLTLGHAATYPKDAGCHSLGCKKTG
jgi:hypothetical protein